MTGMFVVGLILCAVAGAWTRWAKRHPKKRDYSDSIGIVTFAICGLALSVASFAIPGITV